MNGEKKEEGRKAVSNKRDPFELRLLFYLSRGHSMDPEAAAPLSPLSSPPHLCLGPFHSFVASSPLISFFSSC